jgi:hypothetical protein
MRRFGIAAAALGVLALTACSTTGTGAPTPSASTTATGTGLPSTTSPPSGTIPAAALLQAADLEGVEPKPANEEVAKDLRPPRPCGSALPSDSARLGSVAVTAALLPVNVSPPGRSPSVIMETIVRYRAGAGTTAFSDLKAALQRCPGQLGKGKQRWELVGGVSAGDEAILFRMTTQFTYGDDTNLVTKTTPVALARVGDDLVLVTDLGWETSGGDEAVVRRLIVTAVGRLRAAT